MNESGTSRKSRMPLHPNLAGLRGRMGDDTAPRGAPSGDPESIENARELANHEVDRAFAYCVEPGPRDIDVTDHLVTGPGGEFAVRSYRPRRAGTRPAYLYLHGGGWWMCTIDQYDHIGRDVAAGTGACVLMVDYRLAPEHPHPAALDDCTAALAWAVAEHRSLGIDPDRIAVGGDSAGGNLAAALCLRWRDSGARPPIRAQVLEVPVTDATQSYPSIEENERYVPGGRSALTRARRFYCPDESRLRDAYVSPVFAADLAGLPPALVLTAEYDPLRDEGEAYAARLAAAGVPVTAQRGLGYTHGAMMFTALIPEARAVRESINDFLRRHLALASAPA